VLSRSVVLVGVIHHRRGRSKNWGPSEVGPQRGHGGVEENAPPRPVYGLYPISDKSFPKQFRGRVLAVPESCLPRCRRRARRSRQRTVPEFGGGAATPSFAGCRLFIHLGYEHCPDSHDSPQLRVRAGAFSPDSAIPSSASCRPAYPAPVEDEGGGRSDFFDIDKCDKLRRWVKAEDEADGFFDIEKMWAEAGRWDDGSRDSHLQTGTQREAPGPARQLAGMGRKPQTTFRAQRRRSRSSCRV